VAKTGIKPLDRWANKISRIDRMEIMDCSPNAYVVAVGVAVAAFHVFWAIGGPECIDSAWDRVNKKGKPHRGFRAAGFATGPTINPPKGALGAAMVGIGNAAQKIGFGVGLVDGVLDGVYYGSSLIRRYTGCRNVTAPYCDMEMINKVPLLFPAVSSLIFQWDLMNRRGFEGDGSGIAYFDLGTQTLSATYALQQDFNRFPPLPDCTFTSQLWDSAKDKPMAQNWAGLGTILTASGVSHIRDYFPGLGGGKISVLVEKDAGVMFIKYGTLRAVGGALDSNMSAYECGASLGKI
jgi:hypothetical protein